VPRTMDLIMKPRQTLAAASLLALLLLPTLGLSQDYQIGTLAVEQAWARESPPTVTNGAAFMTITNRGTSSDRLVSAEAEVSERVELHTHLMDDGVMRMRQVDSIELKPGEVTQLKPGGLHVMFIGLKAPFKAGEQVPVTLRFEQGGSLEIDVPVKTMDQAGAMMQEHGAAAHDHGASDGQ